MLLAAKIHPRFEKQFPTVKDMLPNDDMSTWSLLEKAMEWEDRHEFLKEFDAASLAPAVWLPWWLRRADAVNGVLTE